MRSKAEEYRNRAEEAESIARMETDKSQRSQWEAIARQWRALAKQAEETRWCSRLIGALFRSICVGDAVICRTFDGTGDCAGHQPEKCVALRALRPTEKAQLNC